MGVDGIITNYPNKLFEVIEDLNKTKTKSEFWEHVQLGGGLGLGFGGGYTNISIAPSAIYNFNEKVKTIAHK